LQDSFVNGHVHSCVVCLKFKDTPSVHAASLWLPSVCLVTYKP
jgi:hypothetical protein